jgi:hypothetical protein
LAIAIAVGGLKAFQNWYKHGGKEWLNLPWTRAAKSGVIIACILPFIGGCATPMLPALGSRTIYDMSFSDSVGPFDMNGNPEAEGQDTIFNVKVKAPAGTDIADIVGMDYQWEPDKGHVSVSKEATQSSQGQAAALTEINAQNAAAVSAIVAGALQAAAQTLPVYWQQQAAQGANQAQLDAQTATARLNALQAIVDRLLAALEGRNAPIP